MNESNIDIANDQCCDYGCGQKANYIFKNGKHCCSKTSNKCPAVKRKLSNSMKQLNEEWHANGQNCKHHSDDPNKKKRNRTTQKIDNHGKCDNPGCTNFNDGSYGSGRFCSEHCAYAYAMNTTKDSPKRKKHYDKLHKVLRQTKWKDREWKCKVCGQTFDTRYAMKQHLKTDHFHLPNGNYVHGICPFCEKTFDKPQSLGGHIVNCKMNPNKKFYDDAHKRAGQTLSTKCKEHPETVWWRGKHHTKESREKISTGRANSLQNEYLDKPYAKIKWYKVQNIKGEMFSVRGGWEVNVAKHLNDIGIYWTKAKPITYISDIVRRYTPDFYIPSLDAYIEVKGQYPDKDKEKMKLVQEQHPSLKIFFLLGQTYFDFIQGKIALTEQILFSNYIK